MYALVTGASSGIGLQYSNILARDYKYDLVMVSNQEKELEDAAKEIENKYGVKTVSIYKDLATETAPQELFDYCQENNIEIELLVNNAGIFFFNDLTKTSERKINVMIHLHIRTVVNMTRLFGGEMRKRGHGRILNMSSMSAWMAMPGIQIYNASKVFILNFSKSMWYEMYKDGVTVTAITPGAVDTGLYGLAPNLRKLAVALRVSLPPEKLAKKALKATFKGKKQCMPGFLNHIFVPIIKHLPDWVVFTVMKRLDSFKK